MLLKKVLKDIKIASYFGSMETNITGIQYDSRKVKEGDLFICIKGFQVDGHDYIQNAVKGGAVAILAEMDLKIYGITTIKVSNTRAAMPILASTYYNNPTNQLKLIGITGTNGKTTTSYLVRSILMANSEESGLIGTISAQLGEKTISASRTTPEAFDLQKLFSEMVDARLPYAVMEVSSHSLDLNRVDGCEFSIGIFTNLTQDHLDYHKTFDNYREAKKKLFYKTSKANIINIDDYHGRLIIEDIKNLDTKLITYGIENNADIMAKNVEFDSKGVRFILVTPDYNIEIVNSIPGKFSVYNCLAAAAAAYVLGVDKNIIIEGLKSIKNVPGRSEVVDIQKPYTLIIDYAHSPDSLDNILKSIRQYTKGRIITVFGCGGNRETEKRPIMGEVAGLLSDYCIITSDNPRSEEPMEIIRQVEIGMKNTNCDYICIEGRRDAIKFALTIAREDDVILLAGKGHETYQEIKEGKISFDEKEIVYELIREEV